MLQAKLGHCACAAVLLLTAAAASDAQVRQYSDLTGTVRDASGGVLPGATVRVSSTSLLGGPQESISDGHGVYRFNTLTLGVYEVTASRQGFRPVTVSGVDVPFASRVTLDLVLQLESVSEEVVVDARPTVIQPQEAAVPTRISREFLQGLPMARTVPFVQNLAPGVNANVGFGGTQLSNALAIDGITMTDPGTGGNATVLNFNWLQEVQVVSLGASAEYGGYTGTAANARLVSGSNRFSGLADYYTTRGSWVGDNRGGLDENIRELFAPRVVDSNWDASAQLGGPLSRDRLWFFTGYQYTKRADRPAGVESGFTTIDAKKFMGKLSWAPAHSVRVEGFFSPNTFDTTNQGLSPTLPAEAAYQGEGPGWQWNSRLTWTRSARTLVEVRAGGFDSRETLEPVAPNTRTGPAPHLDLITGVSSVTAATFSDMDTDRTVVAAALTRYADGFGRHHEFKFGAEFDRSTSRVQTGYPGGRSYLDLAGEPYLVDFWDGSLTHPTNTHAAFFAQDSWTVTPRLVLHPGLRIAINRGSVPGKGNVFSTTPISPRIGAAWDILGDHKWVGRIHYGRYHDPLVTAMYDFMDTTQVSQLITAFVLGPNEFEEISRSSAGDDAIDADIRHSFVDQWLVGVERELTRDLSVQLQYIQRDFDDFIGFMSPDAEYAAVIRTDPGPDGRLRTDDDRPIEVFNRLTSSPTFILTNPERASRRYRAVQLIARKRLSHGLEANGSYTWSRTRGNVTNRFIGNTPQSVDLGRAGIFVDPNKAINADGRSPFDFTHQVKLEATYAAPWLGGFNAGAVYRYTSGAPWGRTVNIQGLSQGTALVRTETRGTHRTDASNVLDLRLEKTLVLGSDARRLGLYLDVFNVGNHGVPDAGSAAVPVRELSGPSFGLPQRWIEPRTARLGVRVTF